MASESWTDTYSPSDTEGSELDSTGSSPDFYPNSGRWLWWEPPQQIDPNELLPGAVFVSVEDELSQLPLNKRKAESSSVIDSSSSEKSSESSNCRRTWSPETELNIDPTLQAEHRLTSESALASTSTLSLPTRSELLERYLEDPSYSSSSNSASTPRSLSESVFDVGSRASNGAVSPRQSLIIKESELPSISLSSSSEVIFIGPPSVASPSSSPEAVVISLSVASSSIDHASSSPSLSPKLVAVSPSSAASCSTGREPTALPATPNALFESRPNIASNSRSSLAPSNVMEGGRSNLSEEISDRYDQSTGRNHVQNPAQFHPKHPVPTISASVTPSSVDDVEAIVPAELPDTTAPLSVRHEKDRMSHSHTAVHHAHSEPLLQPSHLEGSGTALKTIQPSALTVEEPEEVLPGSVRLGPAEFAVTLPMDSRVKDDYERVLTDAAASIREFLATFSPDSRITEHERDTLLSRMCEITARLNNVSTHPDLNISQYLTDKESDLTKEASWAEYSSAKFLFLGHLIEVAASHDLHLILAVQDGRKQDIIERYLRGKGFNYTRPREKLGGSLEVSLTKGPLSFGVHASDSVRDLYKTPAAVIVLDTAFNHKTPSVQHIRTTYTRNGSLLPLIWLFVSNSCEHIERCLPDLPESERMRLLLQYTARLHDDVGDLQDDALGVHEDVEELLNYLLDDLMNWPLPAVEPLHFVSVEEMESSTPSSNESQLMTQKRSLPEEDPNIYTSKRARVDVQDTSQLTDSTKPLSQSLDQDLDSLERNLVHMKTTHAAEKEQLRKELLQARSQVQQMEKALSDLQHRYESRTKELHMTRQERDSLIEHKSSLEQRVDKAKEDILKLKEDRSKLQEELEEARQELKNGGGSLADLETAREEIRRLNKEQASLERKADYEKNQAEYTREQYQTASTVAAQAGNEARQLREENENLKRKVAGNAVRLRELTVQSDTARHLSRIAELEQTLASRDELLRRKEEELREIRKNRPSTRSTSSQPRSPKWAAGSRPTSPGVNNGNGNNGGLAGRGSALRFSSEVAL